MKTISTLFFLVLLSTTATTQDNAAMESVRARSDVPVNTNPKSEFWRGARPVYAEVDGEGKELANFRTEVRSRWTQNNIYFLFVCPFRKLSLKPDPNTQKETYELWNWNVAEVFLGSDFQDIKRYKEFEVSPQNEWIDLDVDLHNPHHEQGWVWNSGFEHAARVDAEHHIWYAAIKVPFHALDSRQVKPGNKFRLNLYRTDGEGPQSLEVMWRPVMSKTFHVPERFGGLVLVAK